MINDGATDIIIPWHYRATDLMDVLEPLVTTCPLQGYHPDDDEAL
jgi:hypothetical protein